MAIAWKKLQRYYLGQGSAPAEYRIQKEHKRGEVLYCAYINAYNIGDSKTLKSAKNFCEIYDEQYKPSARTKNPIKNDIVLRAGDMVATIGDAAGRTFLVLKRRGERKPLFDQWLDIPAIAEKLDALGFNVSKLRAANPLPRKIGNTNTGVMPPRMPRGISTIKAPRWPSTVPAGRSSKAGNTGVMPPRKTNPARKGKQKETRYWTKQDDGSFIIHNEPFLMNSQFSSVISAKDLPYYRNAFRLVKSWDINAEPLDMSAFERSGSYHPAKRGRNPVPEGRTSKLRKATRLYEDFRDKPGAEILDLPMPDFSTGMVIGRLTAVEYDTVRGNQREDYRHKFKKSAAPLLCVTACGKYLFTVNGGFTFTERGIVDNE